MILRPTDTNNHTRRAILLPALFFLAFPLFAQENRASLFLKEQLEQLTLEEEYSWENELEELAERLQEPINLNAATREQLEQLPFLTDKQVEELLAYVYINGGMQTIYELQLVKEMDRRTIELLTPFVCVKPIKQKAKFPTLKQMLKYGRHEALTRLDVPFYTRKGYETSYLGPSMYHSLRYQFKYGDYVQMGLTAEKDAGEPMFGLHNRKGYDHYSPYLLIQNLGRLKALAVGYYRLNYGMGLVLNSSFQLGKTFSLIGKSYRSGGIRKHSSTDEFNYFRGIAATVEVLKNVEVSAFYSHRSLDGTIRNDTISAIDESGLHRSQKEADKRNTLTQQLMGGHISYRKGALQFGVTGIYHFFDRPYEPRRSSKYTRFNLHGQEFYNIGMDYRLPLGRLMLTGEAAIGTQGYATVNQLHYRLSPDYNLLLVHRYYAHDYWSYFGRSFGEGSRPQNENGWYVAAEAAPIARWRFFVAADFFSFPWWKYRISKPSQGIDLMAQATYTPRPDLTIYANYRYKQKERDISGTEGKQILPTYQHRVRLRLNYTPANWTLRTTADYTYFGQQTVSHGYQLTQLCAYTLPFGLNTSAQATYFHTDDYDSRLYVYEPGLLNTFQSPSYYGRGFRYSLRLSYNLKPHFTLLAKVGQTLYQDRNEIGSGNDLIRSNRKTDLQLQLQMKF